MSIIIAISCFLLIAYLSTRQKVKSEDDYLLAGRNTSLFPLVATLVMTEFNTATLISFSSLGYLAGYWALTMPFIFLFGLLFYTLSVSKKWKGFNGISVAHFFAKRYGRGLELFVAIVLFFTMLGFSATYVKSLTLLFMPLFKINAILASLILLIVIILLTIRGGLKSIIKLDIISFCFVLIFFPILLYYSYRLPIVNLPARLDLQQMQKLLPPRFIISLIIITMFSYILAPWYGQKIVAAKDQKTAYIATAMAAVIIFALYSIGVYTNVILQGKGIILANRELGIPYLIYHALPSHLAGISYVILFFIAASTLTGVWSAMVTLIVGSIFRTRSHNVKRNVYWMFICSILTYIISNTLIDNILNKMILFNVPIVALSFALLGGFYWKKANKFGAYTSIIVGIVWGGFCYLCFGENGLYTWYWSVYGVPLIFITGALSSGLSSKKVCCI